MSKNIMSIRNVYKQLSKKNYVSYGKKYYFLNRIETINM